jgi:5-methylcytosine-specific restriction endonuclease McrA
MPNYARPAFDATVAEGLQKPERRRHVKKRAKVQKKLTRAQVREIVYGREKMRCERCGQRTKRPNDCTWGGDPTMAHVNERVPRSKGGNPLEPKNCELTCQACHLPGGQHAPTKERMQKLQRKPKATNDHATLGT